MSDDMRGGELTGDRLVQVVARHLGFNHIRACSPRSFAGHVVRSVITECRRADLSGTHWRGGGAAHDIGAITTIDNASEV